MSKEELKFIKDNLLPTIQLQIEDLEWNEMYCNTYYKLKAIEYKLKELIEGGVDDGKNNNDF